MKTKLKFSGQSKRNCLYVATQFYPPDYAPTGQLIHELAAYLTKRGRKVKIFTGQPGYAFQDEAAPRYQSLDNVFIRRTQTTRLWSKRVRGKLLTGIIFFLRTSIYFLKNVRSQDTVLLPTTPPFLPVLGYILNLLCKIPYVCLIYDLYPDVVVELGLLSHRSWITRLWNLINSATWSRAEQVVVLSDSMKARIVGQHPQLQYKIKVIHNWADPNWITPITKSQNWFAQEHQLTNVFTILYSGNMGRCHDQETILEAAIRLQGESIQFVFIGGGAGFKLCEQQVKALNLQNCKFLPYLDRKDLPYSLAAADLSLVSMKAGMDGVIAPSKLYSIMASGRPIAAISPPESYLGHLIQEADCGKVFRNGDSLGLANYILDLASNAQLADRLGKAGREYLCRNFTLNIIAEQYAEVLNSPHAIDSRKGTSTHSIDVDLNGFYSQGFRSGQRPIGQLLHDAGLLSSHQVNEILKVQFHQYPHLRFGEVVVLKGWIPQDTIDAILKTAA